VATRTRLTRAERRGTILAAAKTLFGERGYRKTEVEAIAAACYVTKPMIYRHFPGGKAELFIAVLDEHVSRLMSVLWEAISSSSDPRHRLHRGLRAYVDFAQENPQGFHLLASATGEIDPEIGARLRDVRERLAKGLSATIADVMAAAGLRAEGAEIYAHALLGGVDSVLSWWLHEGEGDVDSVVDYLLAFIWRGFDGLPRDPKRFHLERTRAPAPSG
jgi:AcrR family transcriptional regulator